jgi:predicted dehydrogenase
MGVAGAGTIGRTHIALIEANPACRLTAIVDPAPAAADVARASGAKLFTTLADLLTTGSVDGVVVATPNALHVSQALECIAAGVPALVDKPVALSVAAG